MSARQRTGRILRNKPDGRPALAIDIVDAIASNTAPQVSMADIFTLESIKNGAPIGDIAPLHLTTIEQSIKSIFKQYGSIKTIVNNYTLYAELLETLPRLTRGQASIKQNGRVRTFASASRLLTRLAVDSFALNHLKKHKDIDIRLVRRHHEAIEAYDEQQIQDCIATLPSAVHTGQGLRVGDTAYVSLNELINIIQRKYPYVDVSYQSIETVAREIIKSDKDLYFTKRFRARTHRGVTLYTAQTMVSIAVGQSIVSSYRDK